MTDVWRLFAEGVGPEQRDLMCAAMTGKSFAEAREELARDEFLAGLGAGRYLVLRYSFAQPAGDEAAPAADFCFVCRLSYPDYAAGADLAVKALFETESAGAPEEDVRVGLCQTRWPRPAEYSTRLYGGDALMAAKLVEDSVERW